MAVKRRANASCSPYTPLWSPNWRAGPGKGCEPFDNQGPRSHTDALLEYGEPYVSEGEMFAAEMRSSL